MFEIMGMAAWQILALLAFIFVVLEAFTPGFVMLPTGLALAISALSSLFVKDMVSVLLIFTVSEIAMLWIFNKYVKPWLPKSRITTNAEGMVGKEALVIESISPGGKGYVRLYGDEWAAKSVIERKIEKNEKVIITRVEGNHVWVDPIIG